jgi:hypothetical protein
MGIIEDFISTILVRNEYNDDTDDEFDSTILEHTDQNLECEKEILQCQKRNGRLLGSTARALRKKYGKLGMFGSYRSDIVDRAIQRLAMRRKRGKCSVRAEREELAQDLKPMMDLFFKKKTESDNKTGL